MYEKEDWIALRRLGFSLLSMVQGQVPVPIWDLEGKLSTRNQGKRASYGEGVSRENLTSYSQKCLVV